MLNIKIIYFDSFGAEHVSKEIKNSLDIKTKKINIFRIQENNSQMCGYFCIGFIDFMLAGKTLIDYTSLLCIYNFEKKYNIIISHFKNE